MREYLKNNNQVILSRFTDLENVDQRKLSDIRLARKTGGFAYEYWCAGGDLKDVDRLVEHFNTIAGSNPWQDTHDHALCTIDRLVTNIHSNAQSKSQCLVSEDVWNLSLLEREKLLQTWKESIDLRTILDRTAEIHRRHQVAIQRKREVLSEIDARSLADRRSVRMFEAPLLTPKQNISSQ